MGYNVHEVLNKVVVYITLNSTLKINIFWYDFKLSSFFKMKHKICKEFVHFYKFIFNKKTIKIFFWFIGAILIIFHNKLHKKSLIWKSYVGEKEHAKLM